MGRHEIKEGVQSTVYFRKGGWGKPKSRFVRLVKDPSNPKRLVEEAIVPMVREHRG